MVEKNIILGFRLKNIGETRNYFIEKIEQNELMRKQHKKTCTNVNYIENVLFLASVVTGCVSISAFVSLADSPIKITSYTVGLKICTITALQQFKSISQYLTKRRRNMIK